MGSFLLAIAATVTLAISPSTVKVNEHLVIRAAVTGEYSGRVCVRITEPDSEVLVAYICLDETVNVKDGETRTITDTNISSSLPQTNDLQLGLVDGPRDSKGDPSVSNKVRVTVQPRQD